MHRIHICSLLSLALLGATEQVARADEPPPTEPPPADSPPTDPPAEPAPSTEPDAPATPAQPAPHATAKGRIVDKATHEGLPAATLQILDGPGGNASIATELDGTFVLDLAPGTYRIVITTPEYVQQERTITVAAGQELALDVALAAVVVHGKDETVEIYDTIDTHKTSAVLAERRAAATVSDALSAEQIARSPDSTASDAAKRIVSATIQDNRYVVIRGLGGRYSLTLLNGIPLPSPDPDVPAAPLDLFPAALITNLTVYKTASPDLPASFAGGALGIETRTYPTHFTFKAKVGIANNTLASFRRINAQDGGSLDLLGFDDGTRSLPAAIPNDKLAGDPSLPIEQRNSQIAAFEDNWQIRHGTAGPNLNLGATLGDSVRVADKRIGYFASVNLGHSYQHRSAHIARVGGEDGMGGKLPSVLQLDDDRGIEQAGLGALASAGVALAPGHRLDAFGLYSHGTDITSSEVTGTENTAAVVDRTRMQFLQRELVFAQLLGEHRLAPTAELHWQANVAQVAQHEPDTRDLLRTETADGRLAISGGSGSAERLFGDLTDTTIGGGVALKIPLEAIKLELGGTVQRGAREYQQRRFHFDVTGDNAFLDPNAAFSPENAGTSMSMYEVTVPTDGYMATRTIAAAYAMADYSPIAKLRFVGGARLELAYLDVGLDSKIDLMVPPSTHTTHDDRDILPSLDAVYAVTPSSNLRAAYGMTVARPNFREIAPALYYDYIRRRAIGGNPDLVETTVHNADLRWETFLGDSEVLAASLFAKRFVDPIERTVEEAGDGQNIGFTNAPRADSYGVELEARISLGRIAPALSAFTAGGNFSLIGSRIDVGVKRPLQGQSPYVANVGIGYELAATRTRFDLLYNSFGRRIEEVGTAGAGNVYEEAFHRLDVVATQPLPRNVLLKLAAGNLLDQRVVYTQDAVEIFAYKVGVTVLGSVELTLE